MKTIKIDNETRLELILRVLIIEQIIDGKAQNKKEVSINYEDLIKKVEEINGVLFDENFIEKIGELI